MGKSVRRRTVRRETRKQRIGRLNQSRRKGRKTLLNKRNRKRRASKKRRTSKRRSNSKRRRIGGVGSLRQCPKCLESYLGFTDVQAISRAQKCTKLPTCPGFIKPTAKGLALLVNNDDPVAAVEVAHAYGDTKAREGLVE